MGDLILKIPDDRELDGPAMSCLPDRHREFVLALGAIPPKDGKPDAGRAAAAVGLSPERGRALLRNPRVADAIREEVNKRFGPAALLAVMGVEKLAGDTTHKDHFGALKWLAAMAGLSPEQKIKVEHSGAVEHVHIDARERVERLAERMGKTPQQVLEMLGVKIMDAEFTEVETWEVDA